MMPGTSCITRMGGPSPLVKTGQSCAPYAKRPSINPSSRDMAPIIAPGMPETENGGGGWGGASHAASVSASLAWKKRLSTSHDGRTDRDLTRYFERNERRERDPRIFHVLPVSPQE